MKYLTLVLLALSHLAFAEETLNLAPKIEIIEQAQSPENFVPKNWKIEKKIVGDLTKDKIDDVVLALIQKAPATKEADSQRVLLILVQDAHHLFHKAAVAEKLLLCPSCFGMMGDSADIQIEKGVLIVEHFTGSRETQNMVQRFRQDDKSGRFLLIGEDVATNDRLTLDGTRKSSNFLTGEQIDEVFKKNKSVSSKKSKFEIKPVFIEDVTN